MQVDITTTILDVNAEITERVGPQGPIGPQGPQGVNTWGSLSGTLSAQSDLWSYLEIIQSPLSKIQHIQSNGIVDLNVNEYDTFFIEVSSSTIFTYNGFNSGKTINVYLSAQHANYIPHTFPGNTFFSELGDFNTIYSFENYITKILLQNINNKIINFSSLVQITLPPPPPTPTPTPTPPPTPTPTPTPIPYYNNEEGGVGIGVDLLDSFLNGLLSL